MGISKPDNMNLLIIMKIKPDDKNQTLFRLLLLFTSSEKD